MEVNMYFWMMPNINNLEASLEKYGWSQNQNMVLTAHKCSDHSSATSSVNSKNIMLECNYLYQGAKLKTSLSFFGIRSILFIESYCMKKSNQHPTPTNNISEGTLIYCRR